MAEIKKINGYDLNDNTSRTNIGCLENTYNSSKTYKIDDIVVYNKTIYKCITKITSPEAFDSSKWQQICLRDLIIYVKDEIAQDKFDTTKERIIGKWINNKNIYSKTLILKPTGSGETSYTADSLPDNMETAWFDKSNSFLVTSAGITIQGFGNVNNTGYWFDCRNIRVSDKRIYLYVGESIYANSTVYVTVRYTKTTD